MNTDQNTSLFSPLCDNSDGLAKSRRCALSYNCFAGIMTALMTGAQFTGLMLAMGVTDGYISAVTLAITICGFAQFFSPLLLERMKQRKSFIMIMRSIYHFFNVAVLGIIPLLPIEKSATLVCFFVAVIIGNLVNALTLSGLSIWHIQCLPEHHRSSFFTIANVGVQVLNSLSSFLTGKVVDTFTESGVTIAGITSPLVAFLIIRLVALLLGAAEILMLSGIKEFPYAESESRRIDLRTLFVPLKNRPFMRIILIYIFYYFVTAVIGRYFQTYLLDVVHMSYAYQSLSGVIGMPIILVLSPVWSRLLKKCSWERVLPIAILGMACGYFFNTLITETTQYFHIVCCVIYAAFHVAIAIIFAFLPFTAMPETDRTTYIGFFTISGSVAGLIGNLFGMLFMKLADGVRFELFGLTITSYQLLNLVQTLLFVAVAAYSVFATRARADQKTT